MPNKVRISLEAINRISRQLMSQLDIQIENSDSADKAGIKPTFAANASKGIEKNLLNDEQLLSLVTERQSLITKLFEVHTQAQLNVQLPLINEMVFFDEQLTSKSQNHKKSLAARILNLKVSKKVSNLYQKY